MKLTALFESDEHRRNLERAAASGDEDAIKRLEQELRRTNYSDSPYQELAEYLGLTPPILLKSKLRKRWHDVKKTDKELGLEKFSKSDAEIEAICNFAYSDEKITAHMPDYIKKLHEDNPNLNIRNKLLASIKDFNFSNDDFSNKWVHDHIRHYKETDPASTNVIFVIIREVIKTLGINGARQFLANSLIPGYNR